MATHIQKNHTRKEKAGIPKNLINRRGDRGRKDEIFNFNNNALYIWV